MVTKTKTRKRRAVKVALVGALVVAGASIIIWNTQADASMANCLVAHTLENDGPADVAIVEAYCARQAELGGVQFVYDHSASQLDQWMPGWDR